MYNKILPNIQILEDCDMGKFCSFKAGGKATVAVINSVEELMMALQKLSEANMKYMILGNGTNTLFRDEGYDGLVIKLGDGFDFECLEGLDRDGVHMGNDPKKLKIGDKTEVLVGAKMNMATFAKLLLMDEISGFEFASGIPGSIGGAIFMNGGAYGSEMKDIVKKVWAVSPDGKEIKCFTNSEMEFGYRHSILQDNGYIAIEVLFELEKGKGEDILAEMRELAEKRNSKQPIKYPSAGSTFKRPEGNFAGKLIEECNLKGTKVGGAEVSELHAGFIINKDGATATDILELIMLVQETVYKEKGVMLVPEVRIV